MIMEKHNITFVIPFHRMHIKNFNKAYESILAASIKDIEYSLIVILNGQSLPLDNSKYLDEPEKYGIRLIEFDQEKSCSIARNIGFKFVSTEIVIFLDGDIILPNNFFYNLKDYLVILKNNTSIGGLCPLFSVHKNYESGLQKYENLEDVRMLNSYRHQKYVKLLQGFCVTVKSSVFKKVGMFDESFIASEDRELTVRIINAGYKILCMPNIQITHINPSGFKNILKRKRWHAIGNAQLALKHPGAYDGNILEWLFLLFKKPFELAPLDPYAYLYYWGIMVAYTVCFLYFKIRFKQGLIKKDRY